MRRNPASFLLLASLFNPEVLYSRQMPEPKETIPKAKVKVILGTLICVCPNGKRAWYNSNIGPIKKPYPQPPNLA